MANQTIPAIQIKDSNVGIGTTGPATKLDISGTTTNITITDTTYGRTSNIGYIDSANLYLANDPNSNTYIGRYNAVYLAYGGGSVGINTTNPSYKLDVIGNVRSYGGLYSNGYHGDTFIQNLLPAANNGSGSGDVQLRMWCSEPGITWDWAGFGYNVLNDGAGPYGFGRWNGSFGQSYMRFSTDGSMFFYNTTTANVRTNTMVLTAGGNVGIGTTAPANKLVIDGGNVEIRTGGDLLLRPSGNDYDFGIRAESYRMEFGSASFANVAMVYDTTGNVGIGTTGPSQKLHIYGTNPTALIQDPSTGYSILQLDNASNGSFYTAIDNSAGTGFGSAYGRYLYSEGAYPMILVTNSAERIRILSDGNVGIGKTDPVTQLQVTSATNDVDVLRIGNTAGNSGSVQGFTHLAINHFDAGTFPSTRITAYQDGLFGWPGGMYFSTRLLNTDSAPLERMRISSAGNVGIGTTSPANILHITDVMRMDNVAGTAPAVQNGTPDSAYGDPENNRYLADPAIWLRINVGGTEYVIPAYTQA